MKRILSLGILLLIACGSGGEKQEEKAQEQTATIATSVLMVIAHHDFNDDEFKASYDLFTKSGITVVVASTDVTTAAKGMAGMTVIPDITLQDVNPEDYDGLVVVGGDGCKTLWDNETLQQIVRDFNAATKTIAAICLAPMVFANAGILEDKIVTAHPSVRDEIGKCCAKCTDSEIEVSGNVITCSEPKAAANFAQTVLRVMNQ
jgi:protease I